MIYRFEGILSEDVYSKSDVLFAVGRNNIFNLMATDTIKAKCKSETAIDISFDRQLSDDFGFDSKSEAGLNSIDFDTFMETVYSPSINGRWFCISDLSAMNKKQKDKLLKYIKDPSNNGVLCITSTDWMAYREWENNKIIKTSKKVNLLDLSFPTRQILKDVVKQMFEDKNIKVDNSGIEAFINRMGNKYDDYDNVLNDIADAYDGSELDAKSMKTYMHGIENYSLDDFIIELTKPLSSSKTNNKKVLRIMMMLEDEMGAADLVRKTLNKVDECIEYRKLINSGYIPIGIRFFFNDVINGLPESIRDKYSKVKEYTFRKKALLASMTSLQDWWYMHMILSSANKNVMISEKEKDLYCQKALYQLCTRTVLTKSRLNNDIGVEDIIESGLDSLDKKKYIDKNDS